MTITNLFSKIINRVKNYVFGWFNPMRHTKDFYSELALNSIHSDQVDGYVKKFGELYLEEEKEWVSSKIVELLDDQDKVIDIGCGTGRYLKSIQEKSLARKKNINLYGVDISEETIERYTVEYCPNGIVLKSENIVLNRPYKGVDFNVAYSISIIQHIPFYLLGKMFSNVCDTLLNGGYFYLVFPHSSSITSLFKNPRYTRYPVTYVERLLKKNGFEIEDSGTIAHNREALKGPGSYILAKKIL